MGKETKISWTDHTFNIVWGCTKLSAGCAHCYAEVNAKRYGHRVWGPGTARRVLSDNHWSEPLAWNVEAKNTGVRRRVFCGSMCDVFEDHATVAQERLKLWPLIRATPNLDWLLLTKRADQIAQCLPVDWGEGYSNVWLGVTIERADFAHRADTLRAIPAVVRFISYEPALGPLDDLNLVDVDWVIFGGESGAGHRACSLDWARTMKARCAAAGVEYFFKQSGGRLPGTGSLLDGQELHGYPTPRDVARALPMVA